MLRFLLFFMILSFQFIFCQNIMLNEIMASNQKTLIDEDGDYPDWIELYNSGAESIDLSGYGLSDDSLDTQKWIFGQALIEPGQHLIVFASDKNRRTVLSHWETILREGDEWHYKVGDASIPTNWIDSSYDVGSWAYGPSGFGYGDDDDSTDLSGQSPFVSLYIKTSFTVLKLSTILIGVLHVDYDDGFVAYLNGTEIARAGIGTAGVQPAWDETAANHEAVMYNGFPPDRFDIENIAELLVEGENTLAIEVHNGTTTSTDLTLIPFLSFGMTEVPDSALSSPGILGLNTSINYFHTNFKITADGERILLSDTSGAILDQVYVPASEKDVSYARVSDTSQTWMFQMPTPGSENKGEPILGFADSVVVSIPSGFYDEAVSVALSAGGSRIFYTLDGSDPDTSSTEYSSAINIDQTSVLKAVSIKDNYLPGPVVHYTYFINENTDLPVISLSSDPYNLFNDDYGIYTNFTMDWERPAHVEFFEDDRSPGFSENCGIEIYGSQSANWDQKSIAVKFKNDYGVSEIEYPLFPDFNITTFKGLVLRNAGNDWQYTHIRDAMMQTLVKDLDIDYLEYRPATSFINGEYWGIYNIREKINEHYIANRHGVDPDNIDMLENNMNVIHGDSVGYQQLIEYISTNDMATEAAYAYIDSAIDLDECILYFAAQAYYDNLDWPGTNIKFWRERSASGKWRWILFGVEFGFGLYAHDETEDHIAFMFSPVETRYSNPPWATLLQRKLIENPTFKNRFINQIADLLNTNFKPDRVVEVINTLADHISSEISQHRSRWALSGENVETKLIPFAENRPFHLRNHVRDYFGCGENGLLTIESTTGGSVRLNTLRLEESEMPWSGIYFQDNVIHLRAIPRVGYKFDGWSGSLTSNANALELTIGEETNLIATFSVDSTSSSGIVINEINYNSSDLFDAGDWIELYNHSTETIDISNWIFTDSAIEHEFVIPDSTFIESDHYLVLVENDTTFTARFPAVTNYIGNMGFGLNGSGEFIKLTDDAGQIIDSLTYDDAAPWPTEPDGNGPTLELMNPTSDNSIGENWIASADHGSPGKENSVIISIKEQNNAELPTVFKLEQNYPNPFNPTTKISYSVGAIHESPVHVDLSIYNILGQKVATLVNKKQMAGYYSVEWNASGFASGVYIYQLKTDKGFQAAKKLVLLK